MPPTSNMRKSSTQTMTMGEPHPKPLLNSVVTNGIPRRTTHSGRAIRANTTRPTNYYARPFASTSNAPEHDVDMTNTAGSHPTQFFPALQYFSDAITALPKEVMKQFTLMKEVEAKIHGPSEKLGELIDRLMQHPVPSRRSTTNAAATGPTMDHALLSLTANNSTSGSTSASLVNGVPGRTSDEDEAVETDDDTARRQQYHELRMATHSLLANLDEKNVVLAEATRVLALQETRLDSVMPHVDNELSEEGRLGSMSHWAYSDNRQKTKTTASGPQNRRDVAATNSLAAAANLMHENEIAQARKEAGLEATRQKPAKGKRVEHAGDSDFDDKPRKVPKITKKAAANAAAAAAAAGLGISANGEPATTTTKRKKMADKALGAPGMERTISSGGRGAKANRDTPRSTPAAESVVRKTKTKPGPPPKRKVPNSAQNSPMLASSPLVAAFNPMEPPPGGRPQSARLRQNSTATNLRHERVADEEGSNSRPTSAAGKANGNGERSNGRRRVQETTEEHEEPTGDEQRELQLRETSEKLKREDVDMHGEQRPVASRSGSDSRKNSGRNSKVGTPQTGSFPAGEGMVRSRSTRSRLNARGEGHDSSSEEPHLQGSGLGRHRRVQSNSHLVKQLAPFNKSPDLDRHMDNDDPDDDDPISLDDDDDEDRDRRMDVTEREPGEEQQMGRNVEEEGAPPPMQLEQQQAPDLRRSSTRLPVSRRNTLTSNIGSSPNPISRESTPSASPPPPPTSTRHTNRQTTAQQIAAVAAAREADILALRSAEASASTSVPSRGGEEEDVVLDEEEESEHDPDDPDEPKYCYCNRGSYGEMIACDHDGCPAEWFHLGCTELREAPGVEEKWYCSGCRPGFVTAFGKAVGGSGRRGKGSGYGSGRGRGIEGR